jgi:hypothetical protein
MKTHVAALLFTIITGQAFAQSPDATCEVHRDDFKAGGTSSATIVMINDGKPCRLIFRFGGQNPPDTWDLVTPPQSGTVQFNKEAAAAEYLPNPGFAGNDKFTFAVFGRAPNLNKKSERDGRFDVSVTVKPKS